jgi:PKD repeat protein
MVFFDKYRKGIFLLLAYFLLIFAGNKSHATHIMGGDLTWKCIGQDSFLITLTKYRDCKGSSMNNSALLKVSCATNGNQISTLNAALLSVVDITPGTAGQISYCTPALSNSDNRCNNPSSVFPYGIEEYMYTGILVLNNTTCCDIIISHTDGNRNQELTTIIDPVNRMFYIEARMNKCVSPCNSSPRFTHPPVAIICLGQAFVYNQGLVDDDTNNQGALSDSLVYELAKPMESPSNPINYKYPYSYTSPLMFKGWPNNNAPFFPGSYGFHLDPYNGDLMFTPMMLQSSLIAIKVKEYRNGQWIGELSRDIQIIITACPNNTPPKLGGPYFMEICAGETVNFNISSTDSDSDDTLWISWNKAIPNAVWTDENCQKKHPSGFLSWSTKEEDASNIPYTFTVTVKDDATPIPALHTRAYQILVRPVPRVEIIESDSACGYKVFNARTIEGTGLSHIWHIDKEIYTGKGPHNVQLKSGEIPYSLSVSSDFGNLSCSNYYEDTFFVMPHLECDIGSDTAVCENTKVRIKAALSNDQGDVSYFWSTSLDETDNFIELYVYSDTLISLIVRDSVGCDYYDQRWISMHHDPVVNLGNDIHICVDEKTFIAPDYIIDRGIPASIRWADAHTGYEIGYGNQLMISGQGAYVCEIIDTLGCKGLDTVDVIVNPEIIAASWDQRVCERDTAFFEALKTGGDSVRYLWFDHSADSLIHTGRIMHHYAMKNRAIQLVVYETLGGKTCSDTQQVCLRVDPLPQSHFSLPDLCYNSQKINLNNFVQSTPVPGLAAWNGNEGFISPASFVAYEAGPGLHDLYYSYKNTITGCEKKDTIQIQVFSLPEVHAGEDDTLCSGSGLYELQASPVSDNALWTGHPALLKMDAQWFLNTSSLDETSIALYYSYTDKNSCSNSDTLQLLIYKTPNAEANFSPSICENSNPLALSGTPDGGVWYGTAVQNGIFDPFQAGRGSHELIYEVRNYFCVDRDTARIHVYPPPFVQALTMDSATIYCRNTGLIELRGLPEGGAWEGQVQNSRFNSWLGSPDTYTSFYLKYTFIDSNNCINHDTLELTIKPEPRLSISEDIVFCIGDSNTIEVDYENADAVRWFGDKEFSDGAIILSESDNKIIYVPGEQDLQRLWFIIHVESRDEQGICLPTKASRQVFMSDKPLVDFSAFPVEGCQPLQVQFNNLSSINRGSIDRYEWNLDEALTDVHTSPRHTYTEAGAYNVGLKAISNANCSSSAYKKEYIQVYLKPKADFEAVPPFTTISAPTISFLNKSSNLTPGADFYWSFDDFTKDDGGLSREKNPVYQYSDTATYFVQLLVINDHGCSDTLEKMVQISPAVTIFIPNAFTPNRKGIPENEVFRLVAHGVEVFYLRVYNTWGQLVYYSDDYDTHAWDGRLPGGDKAPVGVYMYVLRIKGMDGDDYQFNGIINLIK